MIMTSWAKPVYSNTITWSIDPSVPAPCDQYIDDLLEVLYPNIVRFYGEPCDTHTILVRYEEDLVGGYYDPMSDNIAIGWLPNDGSGATDPDPFFDYFMAHEFIHSFRSYCHWIPSWMEEGTNNACGSLLTKYLADQQIHILGEESELRNLVLWYDSFANLGDEILGGSDWSGGFADWISGPQSYVAVFLIVILSQVQGPIWQWEDYELLAEVNERLYTHPAGWITKEEMINIIAELTHGELDGNPVGEWLAQQPIAADPVHEGRYLAVYPACDGTSPYNPQAVTFFAFEWGPDPTYPHIDSQLRIETGEDVFITIDDVDDNEVFSGQGALITEYPDYPQGTQLALPNTSEWPRGAYVIKASVDLGEEVLSATNYFLAGENQLDEGEGRLGIISVDKVGRLVEGRWESDNCEIIYQERGAAVLEPFDKDILPAQCDLRSVDDPQLTHTIFVPLPYSRVITLEGARLLHEQTDSGSGRVPPVGDCSCSTTSWSTGVERFAILTFLSLGGLLGYRRRCRRLKSKWPLDKP